MKRTFCAAAALLLLSSGAALAGHGRAGLWNTSTVMNMAALMPPDMLAKMKKMGRSPPTAQTIAAPLCITQAEADADRPPQMGKNDIGCDSHVTRQTAFSTASDMVCTGRLKGTGHIEVTYTGAEHYAGSYAFHGSVEGRPFNLATKFTGDWVKANCGSVKPYIPKK